MALKSWSDLEVKFYSILKPMVLPKLGEKFEKIDYCKLEIIIIDFVRLGNFSSAQLESCS